MYNDHDAKTFERIIENRRGSSENWGDASEFITPLVNRVDPN